VNKQVARVLEKLDRVISVMTEEEDAEMSKIAAKSKLVPITVPEQINLFREAVGEEVFGVIASGGSLMEAVDRHMEEVSMGILKESYSYLRGVAEKKGMLDEMPSLAEYANTVVYIDKNNL